MRLLQIESVQGDLQSSESDLVSDDDGEGEGGEVESIPDETDYAGDVNDQYEMALAVQERQMGAD